MKKVLIPVLFLTLLFAGCKYDKAKTKNDHSEERSTTVVETSEEGQKKLASPTPTPISEDLSKNVYYKNGEGDVGYISEYEDGKLASFFEYDHGSKDEEYQTIYTYKDDLLVKKETVYNGNLDKASFSDRTRGYTLYSYNDQDLLFKELIYDENDELVEEYYYLYDEFGYKKETRIENGEKYITMTAPNGDETYFEHYDKDENLIEHRDYEYDYDDFGNKTRFTIIVDGEIEREYLFEYDEAGNETKAQTYWDGKLTTEVIKEYAPDCSWRKTVLISYDYEGNATQSKLYYSTFNENGQETEFRWYEDVDDTEPVEDIFYTYDDNGNLLSIVTGDHTTIYKYDDQDRLLEVDAFYKDELSFYYTYSYEES